MHVGLLEDSQIKRGEEKEPDTLGEAFEQSGASQESFENVLNVKVTVIMNIVLCHLLSFLTQPTIVQTWLYLRRNRTRNGWSS